MKYYTILLVAIVFSVCSLKAQKQDYIWHLGLDHSIEPGIQAMQVNFNKGTMPDNIEEKIVPFGFGHNNQAICDKDGDLLFYTNGCAIMNRNHEVMPHGDTLNHSEFKEITGWDDCKYGYPGIQNLMILDDPGNENGFYILHKTWVKDTSYSEYVFELRSTYIDISLDNGLGDVVYFDSILTHDNLIASYLTAIKHINQKDWWVVQPMMETEDYAVFLIDSDGIHRMANQYSNQYFDYWFSGSLGTARFSPDGTKYVYYNRRDNLHIYDFDRETGLLSNHQYIDIFHTPLDSTDYQTGSVEWSSNGRFLYVTNRDSLHQIDTWEDDIENDGIRLIDVYNGTLDPFPTRFRIMTLAPDCKIYLCPGNGSDSYHVIKHPNELGTDCEFIQNGIKLPHHAGLANLPHHPRWRVDEEDKCDITITSVFGLDVFYRRDLKVYPNPTVGPITIELPDDFSRGNLEIYNLQGQVVQSSRINRYQDKMKINLSELPTGYYHIEVYPDKNLDRIYYGTQIVKIE